MTERLIQYVGRLPGSEQLSDLTGPFEVPPDDELPERFEHDGETWEVVDTVSATIDGRPVTRVIGERQPQYGPTADYGGD